MPKHKYVELTDSTLQDIKTLVFVQDLALEKYIIMWNKTNTTIQYKIGSTSSHFSTAVTGSISVWSYKLLPKCY